MPAVRCLVADGNHDARWLAGFEYDDDCVRLRTFEVGVNELVTTALRGIHHRDLYVFRPGFQRRYRGANVNFVRVWLRSGGFFEAHRANELVEIVDDALVETVALGLLVGV